MNEEEKNNLRKESKKKTLILTLIAIVTLLLVVVGATYAFFASQNTGKQDVNINAESGTTDVLTFEKGSDIGITANMDNFASDMGSEEGKTIAKAKLTANDATNEASDSYYVYLKINTNELRYTNFKDESGDIKPGIEQEDKTITAPDATHTTKVPELILTIKETNKATGETKELNQADIEDLTYYDSISTKKKTTDSTEEVTISGFDITEAKGMILLKYENIHTSNEEKDADRDNLPNMTTHEWEITVTLINLDSDQNNNTGKTFDATLMLQKEESFANLADACTGKILGECIKENYKYDNNIYFHNADLTGGAEDESYRYAGVSYIITDKYKKNYSQIDDELIKRTCSGQDVGINEYKEICYDDDRNNLSKYYLAYKGKDVIYDSYYEAYNQAIKDNYLEEYIVKNYVCLDGTETTDGECSSDADLYRIIGLFKNDEGKYEMKLIKHDYATSEELGSSEVYKGESTVYKGTKNNLIKAGMYYWYSSREYGWKNSPLRETHLNTIYLNYLKNTKKINTDDLIVMHSWSLKGNDVENGSLNATPKEIYDNEINGYSFSSDSIDNQIGLMYMSDYSYSTSPSKTNNWSVCDKYSADSWMNRGLNEWTISINWAHEYTTFTLYYGCGFSFTDTSYYAYAVRPCFYLSANTKIKSGEGTHDNPFRLSWN